MPLSTPAAREELHNRTIEMKGYRREDGLYDMEGRITDIKTEFYQVSGGRPVPPNTRLHDMWVRLTIDEKLEVRMVESTTDFSPFPECPGAATGLQALKGANMGKGWRKSVSDRLEGVLGCTHVRELLNTMGSTAHQSMGHIRRAKQGPQPTVAPPIVNTCFAYASEGDVVSRRWPHLFPPKAVKKNG